MKIRPAEAELFHADRQTDGQMDMTELIIAFRNFASAPKKGTAKSLFLLILLVKGAVNC
jgi:hypothetical protein